MSRTEDIFTLHKGLDEIRTTPDRIISVYSLEQHIKEFQINPVRSFLNDILGNMAAPYRPERRIHPIGEGYWIQAEFGSGKSHLLCFLSALALGNRQAWEMMWQKEQKVGRGRRESLYQVLGRRIRSKEQQGQEGDLRHRETK